MNRRKFIFNASIGGLILTLPSPIVALNNMFSKTYYQHGIASGDATQNSIILWTRIDTIDLNKIKVLWEVATDEYFKNICASGTAKTSHLKDYTVKVDCNALQPNTQYYYRFKYLNQYSKIGEFKTLPEYLTKELSFAIVSCNNYEDGYFNSFKHIARQSNIDYVCHLGDYIYEYETLGYANPEFVAQSNRVNDPKHEIVTLDDYRRRYKLYRSDKDLQLIHQYKAFYCMWDDHELANNAYLDGAKNHQINEGDWEKRKAAALQAYFEWMPVRATTVKEMIRKLSIGTNCQLYFLEERLDGRTKQETLSSANLNNDQRKLISNHQFNWLKSNLENNKIRWHILLNQVMFTGYHLPETSTSKDVDWWTGYPKQREQLIDVFKNMDNPPIILTGDHHQAHVLELKDENNKKIAFEFLTPSITSKNDDRLSEDQIISKRDKLYKHNPHLVYSNTNAHGYFILKVNVDDVTIDYRFSETIYIESDHEIQGPILQVTKNNQLKKNV